MQVSSVQRQGAHKPLTSLQREESVSGNFSVAASRLDMDEPESKESNKRKRFIKKYVYILYILIIF